jgi:uncharacterized membrane protein YfcA
MFAQGASLINWAVPSPWARGTWPLSELTFSFFTSTWHWVVVALVILAVVLIGSVIGALIGAKLYKKVNDKHIKKIYCGVLVFVLCIATYNLVMHLVR